MDSTKGMHLGNFRCGKGSRNGWSMVEDREYSGRPKPGRWPEDRCLPRQGGQGRRGGGAEGGNEES